LVPDKTDIWLRQYNIFKNKLLNNTTHFLNKVTK